MRFVTRGTIEGIGDKASAELDAARKIFEPAPLPAPPGAPAPAAPKKPSYDFKVYKDPAHKAALEKLFFGKCAYCETFYNATAPVDIEHYRPKGEVAEAPGHPGYWWLAMVWENLLPSCIDCNRKRNQLVPKQSSDLADLYSNSIRLASGQSGKKDSFPIRDPATRATREAMPVAAEDALLLNPCIHDPEAYLAWHFPADAPIALALPVANPVKALVAATSIHVYGLNRLGLVQERTRVLRHLEVLGDVTLQLGHIVQDLDDLADGMVPPDDRLDGPGPRSIARRVDTLLTRMIDEMKALGEPHMPHSAMVQAWLRIFEARLA
ncbi:MAG: hypothetical protein ACKVOB_09715 [Sphingomonas sp.]